MSTDAYPLSWPDGWPRTDPRKRERARFAIKKRENFASGGSYLRSHELSVAEGIKRVLGELDRLGAFGTDLPALRWGSVPDSQSLAWVSWCGNHTGRNPRRAGAQVSDLGRGREGRLPRVGKKAAASTPPEFRDVLLAMARSAHG